MKKADATSKSVCLRLTRTRDQSPPVRFSPAATPESDRVHPILTEILSLVPVARWSFAHIAPSAQLGAFSSNSTADRAREALADEYKRQCRGASTGRRIEPALRDIAGFARGITLLFADARACYGILTLHRREPARAFTSSEIGVLTFALEVLSDRLSGQRLQLRGLREPADRHTSDSGNDVAEGTFYVLNSDLQIMLAGTPEDEPRGVTAQTAPSVPERLPALLEKAVRELTSGWANGETGMRSAARPVSFLLVRTQPMAGPAGFFIGVRIDRRQPPNSLSGAAARYHISPREVQVLALLLDGNHLHQIADELSIAPSTVQDHIKSMLGKTGSGNRSELIARVLGWESARRDGLAS